MSILATCRSVRFSRAVARQAFRSRSRFSKPGWSDGTRRDGLGRPASSGMLRMVSRASWPEATQDSDCRMSASRVATSASALRISMGGNGPDFGLPLVLGQQVAGQLQGLAPDLEVLDGVDQVPIGLLDAEDRVLQDGAELDLADVQVVAGDDDVALVQPDPEIAQEGLPQAEGERASVARIDGLEAAVAFAFVGGQGGVEAPPRGHELGDLGRIILVLGRAAGWPNRSRRRTASWWSRC